jgi:hypothetical protein
MESGTPEYQGGIQAVTSQTCGMPVSSVADPDSFNPVPDYITFILVDKRAGDGTVGDQGDQGQAAEVCVFAGALKCMAEYN